MRTCISQVSTLNAGFEQDVEGYADAGCGAIEIWLTKLEQYLETHTLEDCRKLLDARGVVPAAAALQGGLLGAESAQRQSAEEHFRRRLDVCRELGIPCMIVAGDLYGELTGGDLETAHRALGEMSRLAAQRDVRLALEFQARAVFPNNLESAVTWIDAADQSNLGLCLDVFHFITGPSKLADLEHVTRENLFHVHLCDVSGVPRELASDADRILPGDGEFCLAPLVDRLRAIQYDGYVSLELMNPSIWQVPPERVAEVGLTALRNVVGEASM